MRGCHSAPALFERQGRRLDRQTCGQHLLPSGCPALRSNEAGCEIPTAVKDLPYTRNARPDDLIIVEVPRLTTHTPRPRVSAAWLTPSAPTDCGDYGSPRARGRRSVGGIRA